MEDDGFQVSKASRKKTQKTDQLKTVAQRLGIAYSPTKGTPLSKRQSPRLAGTASSRVARDAATAFDPLSPKGRKHGRQSTSTTKAKYCSYGHAMSHFPSHGTLVEQARNIDSVLSICVDDFDFRMSSRHPSAYERSSNKLFWKDASRLLDLYIDIIQELSQSGVNVKPYLVELRKYMEWFKDAQDMFFTPSERKELLFLNPGSIASPVKMAPLDD